jgi:uroporphyrinogen-III decarboxylase
MRAETMTSRERLLAAVHMEKPDRVPICPLIDTPPAATLLGLEGWKECAKGYASQIDLQLRLWDEYGGWDGFNAPIDANEGALLGMKYAPPTQERPEVQVIEKEVWTEDEYEVLIEEGWFSFVVNHLLKRVSDDPEAVIALSEANEKERARFREELQKRGGVEWDGGDTFHPFFNLSLSRGMVNFAEDVFYRPDVVEKAIAKMTPEFIESTLERAKASERIVLTFVEERAGGFFFPLHVFERLWLPYALQFVEAMHAEGIVTVFHLDACFDKNIAYFKQFPKGSIMLDLDGSTDIFKAREVLGDQVCLGGDVDPALLSLGKPEEISAYCRRLIDEVGRDGGLSLNVGCSVPYAVEPENFRAFLETGKTYELSR